jgi:hypothetical protein
VWWESTPETDEGGVSWVLKEAGLEGRSGLAGQRTMPGGILRLLVLGVLRIQGHCKFMAKQGTLPEILVLEQIIQ